MTATFAYNPASQIASTVRTGDAYAWTGHGNGSTAYTQNGLNQQATVGGAAAAWDSKGNLTTEPQSGKTYGYSSENLLTSASGGVTLSYDPALRLSQTVGVATTKFLYDGADAIAEYNGSGALQRRFIFDPTTGQPVLWYEGTGTAATNRRYLGQDERGSVISVSDSTSASLGLNTYDEYGKPGASNLGRYQYTGQKWIGEAGLYDYKARDYVPQLGIFAQTDPIGYADSANLYAYVGDDPLNFVDPLGLAPVEAKPAGWLPPTCGDFCTATITGNWDTGFTVTGYNPVPGSIINWLVWGDPPGTRATDDRPFDGSPGVGVHRTPREDRTHQCPESGSTIAAVRYWASRTADLTGNASNILALGGAIVPPAAPVLETTAGVLKTVSFLGSGVLLIADAAYAGRTGNWSVFFGDAANFGIGIIPLGKAANVPSRLSAKGKKLQEHAVDTAQGFNVTYNLPAPC